MTTTVPNINSISGNDQQQPFNGEPNKIAPLVWAAIISGAASLASAGVGYAINRTTNRENREITQQQNAFNAQQASLAFNRETTYNDPSAQVQRYINAGLNPNLLMGNPSNTAQSPSASAGSAIPMQPFNPMLQFSQDFLNLAQARNIDAQTNMMPEQQEKLNAEIKNILSQSELANETINKIKSEISLNSQQLLNLSKQVEQIDENIKTMRQNRDESKARIDQIRADIDSKGVQSRYVRAMAIQLENQNSLWDYEKEASIASYQAVTQEQTLSYRQIKNNMDLLLTFFKTSLEADSLEAFNRYHGADYIATNYNGNPLHIFGASILSQWLNGNANGSAILGAARGTASDVFGFGAKLLFKRRLR